eukprot:SAG31_NODE_4769_length_2967_cov_1.661437_3_plen_174_part_00
MVWINVGLVDAGLGSAATTTVVILVRPSDVHGHHPAIVPAACAVARACPIFSAKAQDPSSPARHVVVGFVGTEAPTCLLCGTQVSLVAPAAFDAVRLTARLAETPAEQMSCAQVETEAKQLLHGLPNVAVSRCDKHHHTKNKLQFDGWAATAPRTAPKTCFVMHSREHFVRVH